MNRIKTYGLNLLWSCVLGPRSSKAVSSLRYATALHIISGEDVGDGLVDGEVGLGLVLEVF
jgi:hypothetical protein